MTLFEKGRVCVVNKGSDAGKTVVVKEKIDEHFVVIVGDKVKERRINIKHLTPTAKTVKEIPQAKKAIKKEKAKK
ncbi:50S ribosomal protein L14e [Candidatus Micrarchaeota archaeon]|nr:MAG: 50S ribosomal protein L14e [Candidatus Micrarchaeota archaeon]